MSKRTSDETPSNQLLLDEAPLFAGLEGYVIQKHDKPQPNKPVKTKVPKEKKSVGKKVEKVSSKAASQTASNATTPKKSARKTVSPRPAPLDPDAILLSIREICHLLKISRATLVRMDNAGKVPGKMKLGGSIRFHRATVESWLESMITHTDTPF